MDFRTEFEERLRARKLSFDIRGVVTGDRRVYPIGSDTKVLSSIFELVTRPLVYKIAKRNGLVVREARAQNIYPDFTLMRDEGDRHKIAVDVKTTYRDGERSEKVSFTLGSYTSFIREHRSSKNIEFDFKDYAEHWIVGYIYRRVPVPAEQAHVYRLRRLDRIAVPFDEVDVFVQEKWRIAGRIPGSGNTTNIGSIRGTIDDFRAGLTPFSSEDEFLDYWRRYGPSMKVREPSPKIL